MPSKITSDGVKIVASALKYCYKLENLGLNNNNIGSNGEIALSSKLKSFASLQTVPWLVISVVSNFTTSKSMVSKKRSTTHASKTSKNASNSQYFLLMLVMSIANSICRKRREGIRRSWMKGYKEKTPRLLIMFSMGTGNISPSEMKELKNEQSHYEDLLLLTDLHDHYSNLTRKLLMSVVEVDNNYKFSYFMKCDDDIFIVLDKLVSELKERYTTKKFILGVLQNKWLDQEDRGKF